MAQLGGKYAVGIYGARHVCSLISAAGLARASFIAGLSTGFAGNLGFALPSNWAFNQIQTLTVGSGSGAVEVDKNVASGRDVGVSSAPQPSGPLAPFFAWLDAIQALAEEWVASGQGSLDLPTGQLVLQYMRFPSYGAGDSVGGNDGGVVKALEWDFVAGISDVQWIEFASNQGVGRIDSFIEPSHFGAKLDPQHLAASTDSARKFGIEEHLTPNIGDGGGWAGDLYSIVGQWQKETGSVGDPYDWAVSQIGTPDSRNFKTDDFFEDIDALVLGARIRSAPASRTSDLFRDYYSSDASHRFAAAYQLRFGGTPTVLQQVAESAMLDTSNAVLVGFRELLIAKFLGSYSKLTQAQAQRFAKAFADVFSSFLSKE